MAGIPRDRAFDSSLALLREGYDFIPRRCRRYRTDIFATRLMLRPVVCISGPGAAEAFYADGRFTRRDAMPRSVLRLLQDRGSVQGLDGEAHRRRKAMFMSIVEPERISLLFGIFAQLWRERLPTWGNSEVVVLLDEAEEMLFEAACRWIGLPVVPGEVAERTEAVAAMIAAAGKVGPQNWYASWRRRGVERWLADCVRDRRSGSGSLDGANPLGRIAAHRDHRNELLDPEVAAVELLNLLRPIVAVANYIAFAAVALHQNAEWRARLAGGDDSDLEYFAQEVRRFYPFFPFVAGRAREDFVWSHHRFSRGDWVLLDLYGTNRDTRAWDQADRFLPDRFRTRQPGPFDLIPQGGGDPRHGHRCPGDEVAVGLVKQALALLSGSMRYAVPPQDLDHDLSEFPALPQSGFRIEKVAPID